MRHLKKNRILSREKAQRKALLRALAKALILKEKVVTTQAKAKEARIFVEKLVTRAKKASLSSQRLLLSRLSNDKKVVKKLIEEIAHRYKDRPGGYTRIIKLGPRKSDGARMAQIEFV